MFEIVSVFEEITTGAPGYRNSNGSYAAI